MKDFTTGNERKHIISFATPILIGSLFQQLYQVADSLIVGNFLGKEALAAVGVSFPVIFAMVSLLIGLTIGLSIIVSQYFGAKDYNKVKEAIDTIYIFLFFTSIIVSGLSILFSKQIMDLLNIPIDIENQALSYFNIFAAGLVFLFGFNATNAILRGLGDSKTPLYALIISTVLNLVLDYIFVVFCGWGVESVALATVISQFIAFVLSIVYLNKYHKLFRFSLRKMKFNAQIFRMSLKIGIPSGLQQFIVAIGIMALVRIVNDYGTASIAAYSVATRIDSFAALPGMIFASALTNFVAQNVGAGRFDRVRKGLIETAKISLSLTLAISLLLVIFREYLIAAFNADAEVVSIGGDYLLIVASFFFLFTAMFLYQSVLRGAGDAITPMLITLVALWIARIPFAYALSSAYGIIGVWWGIPSAWLVGFVLAYYYYKRGRWKKRKLVAPQIPVSDLEYSEPM